MIPWLTFPVRIDREKWQAFKNRAEAEGLTATQAIYDLIDQFISKGIDKTKAKKKDKKP